MRSSVRSRRRGIVLIIVLVAVVILSLTAYTFTDLMNAHLRAAIQAGKQVQTRLLVDSGVDAVKLYLAGAKSGREQMGGHFNNPVYFQAAKVIPATDAIDRGSYSVLASFFDDATLQSGVRYGLEDESSRLNLNLLLVADKAKPGSARLLLMALPNMIEDTADAILDWMDSDNEPREFGAEDEDYATLSPPYFPRNAPPATVEELLLVRGVTPDMLFGFDMNRNGMQDANELNGPAGGLMPASAATPSLSSSTASSSVMNQPQYFRGWSSYLTLYSAERNVRSDGTPRIALNGSDLNQLNTELSAVFDAGWTNFILAYRLYGPSGGQGQQAQGGGQSQSGGNASPAGGSTAGQTGQPQQIREMDASQITLDLSAQPQGTFAQVLDLIGKQVQMPGEAANQQILVNSPFADDPAAMAQYLPLLMENCTVSDSATIPGRININQAPREILLGIPGTTEEIVDQIVSARNPESDPSDPNRQHETWLLAEGIVSLTQMRALTPFITAGGDVFRAQIVGYYHGGGTASRAEVIFDASGETPRVLFWRDISHLGRGFALETLGVELAGAL